MDEAILQQVLDRLQSHNRAASYGAVAGMVGSTPQQVMAGRERNARHSWVVNTRTELPTGYTTEQMDQALLASIAAHGVIRIPEDLQDFLTQSAEPDAAADGGA